MPPIKVAIVEDDQDVRDGMAFLFRQSPELRCVAACASAEQALQTLPKLSPDVVLLDIQLPGMDGFAVAERLARVGDPPAVLLISTRDVSSYRRRLARSPARGFISKSELSGDAVSALVS